MKTGVILLLMCVSFAAVNGYAGDGMVQEGGEQIVVEGDQIRIVGEKPKAPPKKTFLETMGEWFDPDRKEKMRLKRQEEQEARRKAESKKQSQYYAEKSIASRSRYQVEKDRKAREKAKAEDTWGIDHSIRRGG